MDPQQQPTEAAVYYNNPSFDSQPQAHTTAFVDTTPMSDGNNANMQPFQEQQTEGEYYTKTQEQTQQQISMYPSQPMYDPQQQQQPTFFTTTSEQTTVLPQQQQQTTVTMTGAPADNKLYIILLVIGIIAAVASICMWFLGVSLMIAVIVAIAGQVCLWLNYGMHKASSIENAVKYSKMSMIAAIVHIVALGAILCLQIAIGALSGLVGILIAIVYIIVIIIMACAQAAQR